jgi:hypothetical protein
MGSLLLQPYASYSGAGSTFVQGSESWVEVPGHGDLSAFIDVASGGSAKVAVTLETSPNRQDSYFTPIGPSIPVGSVLGSFTLLYRSIYAASTVPVARWVRYRLTSLVSGGQAGLLVRMRCVPGSQANFSPSLTIPGCRFWARSDMGATVTTDGTYVGALKNQSDVTDANENLTTAALKAPQLIYLPQSYSLQPTLSFNGSSYYMTSAGAWATPLTQPCTWIVVGHNAGSSLNQYLLDSDDASTGQQIQYNPSSTTITIAAGGSSFSATQSWASPSVMLVEYNGASSKLFFNNFTTPIASGTVAGGTAGSQGSVTLGSANQSLGGGSYWNGQAAELIAYSGVLTTAQKLKLKLYLTSRYGISIT